MSENYKLYRKHPTEIFNMIYDLWSNAPHISLLFELTEKEKEENEQYYESKKPELIKRLKEMGFGVNQDV